jgi:dTDP-4-amino-4,6-dideoxygalactose transaminase
MTSLLEIGARTGVPVVEDAAQAIGSLDHGRQAGTMGMAGAFSFFPSKNLGAFGDAGLITTNDAALAKDIRLVSNHGMKPKYFHSRIGGNFRLDALQAAVLRVKAPHLPAWTDARRRNADRYRELFQAGGLIGTLTLPVEPAGFRHIYNQFAIRGPQRDALRDWLTSRKIGTEIYYPVPFHRQECFIGMAGLRTATFPHADAAAATSLALPIYGELSLDGQRYVVDSIARFYAAAH